MDFADISRTAERAMRLMPNLDQLNDFSSGSKRMAAFLAEHEKRMADTTAFLRPNLDKLNDLSRSSNQLAEFLAEHERKMAAATQFLRSSLDQLNELSRGRKELAEFLAEHDRRIAEATTFLRPNLDKLNEVSRTSKRMAEFFAGHEKRMAAATQYLHRNLGTFNRISELAESARKYFRDPAIQDFDRIATLAESVSGVADFAPEEIAEGIRQLAEESGKEFDTSSPESWLSAIQRLPTRENAIKAVAWILITLLAETISFFYGRQLEEMFPEETPNSGVRLCQPGQDNKSSPEKAEDVAESE